MAPHEQPEKEELQPLRPQEGDASREEPEGTSKAATRPTGVCRICLEEDLLSNLEQPCSCSGSMQSAHRACLQSWIDEKGDRVCEICKQPFKGAWRPPPAPPRPPPATATRHERLAHLGHGFVLTTDPHTGAISARRVADVLADAAGSDDEEYGEEPPAMTASTACLVSAFLMALVMLLVTHLFSAMPRGASGGTHGRQAPGAPSPEGPPRRPRGPGEADGEFEDVSATLLLIWLLMRLLVVVLPFYAVSRTMEGLRGSAGGGAGGGAPGDVELDGVVGRLMRRLEEGGGAAPPPLLPRAQRAPQPAAQLQPAPQPVAQLQPAPASTGVALV